MCYDWPGNGLNSATGRMCDVTLDSSRTVAGWSAMCRLICVEEGFGSVPLRDGESSEQQPNHPTS